MIPKAQQLPNAIATLLDAAAVKHRVSASLVRAVAWIESRGDPSAISAKGARGIMQLMPKTAEELGVVDAFNPQQNIDGGAMLLARLMRKYGGNETHTLAAYNWGPGNVDRALDAHGGFPEQVDQYVRNVQARKAEEGNRDAGTPFFGSSVLELRCPYCSHGVRVVVETEIRR